MDTFNLIMEYENGEISNKDYIKLFSLLVSTGQAWTLQGRYGREARSLIDNGFLTKEGTITEYGIDEFMSEE